MWSFKSNLVINSLVTRLVGFHQGGQPEFPWENSYGIGEILLNKMCLFIKPLSQLLVLSSAQFDDIHNLINHSLYFDVGLTKILSMVMLFKTHKG